MWTDRQELPTHTNNLGDNDGMNILNTCRLCMLTGGTHMEPMFQECIRVTRESSVAEKICSVTQLSPCEGDGLPSVVCQQCLFQLDVADAFIKRCKQSDKSLRSLFSLEGPSDEGTKRNGTRNSQPMTSIPAPLGSGSDFCLTDQPCGTAPNLEPYFKEKTQIKVEPSEFKLIPPPLSSKHHTLPENEALTEINAEVVSKYNTILKKEPIVYAAAAIERTLTDQEVLEESRSQQPKPSRQKLKCPFCPICCDDKHSLTFHVRIHGDKINMASRPHLQPGLNVPSVTPQQSPANANPVTVLQERDTTEADSPDFKLSESALLTRKAELIADCNKRFALEANMKWKCSDCGLVMDRKMCDLGHVCRTFLSAPRCPGDKRSPIRVRLMHVLQRGQLEQLHKAPSVLLRRVHVPVAGHIKGKPRAQPIEERPRTEPIEEDPRMEPNEEEGGTKPKSLPATQVYRGLNRERNYLHERHKIQLLQEIIELNQMKQRLQARLKPVVNGQEQSMQTVKLTQLKLKLQAKLKQPTAVVCSPDLSAQLALGDADLLEPKIEPWNADDQLVEITSRRSMRRLHTESPSLVQSSAHQVLSTNLVDGFVGNVKMEPESEDLPELIFDDILYSQGSRNKKAKFKQSP